MILRRASGLFRQTTFNGVIDGQMLSRQNALVIRIRIPVPELLGTQKRMGLCLP